MAIPQSTSSPKRKQSPQRSGADVPSSPVGRSPLSTRPPINSPSSGRFPQGQGVPSSPASQDGMLDDREAGRRRWEAEQEQRRIESVQHELNRSAQEPQQYGSLGGGRGGDQPRENTYDGYFPPQSTPPKHQPQKSDASMGAFGAMLSSSTGDLDSDDEEDYRPTNVNPTTGMRLPAPVPSAHSSPGRTSPSRSPFAGEPQPKRSLSPPPVGSMEPNSPPPLYAGGRTRTDSTMSREGSGAGPARERVEYQPMSERDRRNSARPQQPALSSPSTPQSGSFSAARQQHQQQPLLHQEHAPLSNPFANPPSHEIQPRHPGQLQLDTRNLSFQSGLSSPFQGHEVGSPFSAAPPSPALAWAPSEKSLHGDAEERTMEERVLIRGRDRGEDRSSKFWNRFSMVAHTNEKHDPKDAAWLKKEAVRTKNQKVWGWIACIIILTCIGGALGAYFALRDTTPAKVVGGNLHGAWQSATEGPGLNTPESTKAKAAAGSATTTTHSDSGRRTAVIGPSATAAAAKRFVLPPAYQVHNGGVPWEDRLSHLDVLPEIQAATVPVQARQTAKRRLATEDDLE